MNNFLQKLLRLKTPVKIAVTLGIIVLIVGAYGGLFYLDIQDQIKGAQTRGTQLQTEKRNYEKRKREYQAYRTELTQLQQEQRDLLKALPKKAEIPTFLSNLQEQAELSGVEIVSLTIDAESPSQLYIRIPVRVDVRGTYHSITKFFKNLSELPRIVNVERLALSIEKRDTGLSPRMRARFVAVTFRYRAVAGSAGFDSEGEL
jgi:type IV pilus assembly protein PilO